MKPESVQKAVFCEHKGLKELKCPRASERLSIINANYGRLSTNFCQFGHYKETNCRDERSDELIKKACDGKNSCQLNPSNHVYGNPCGGVVKYISVKYKCVVE